MCEFMTTQTRRLRGTTQTTELARGRLLSHLGSPASMDYVEGFTALCSLNLEIRRSASTAPLLVRKAILEMSIGNYAAALSAAIDATTIEPDNAEAFHQVGCANFLMALAKAGALARSRPTAAACEGATATGFMAAARTAFSEAASRNAADEEALQHLAIVELFTDGCTTEAAMVAALRHALD